MLNLLGRQSQIRKLGKICFYLTSEVMEISILIFYVYLEMCRIKNPVIITRSRVVININTISTGRKTV